MQAEEKIKILAAAHWDVAKLEQDLRQLPAYSNVSFSPLMLERLLLQLGGMSAAEIAAYKGCSQNAVAQSNQKLNGYLADLFPHSRMHIVAANYAKLLQSYYRSAWHILLEKATFSEGIYPLEVTLEHKKKRPFIPYQQTTTTHDKLAQHYAYSVTQSQPISIYFDELHLNNDHHVLILCQQGNQPPLQFLPSKYARNDTSRRYLPYYDDHTPALKAEQSGLIYLLVTVYQRDKPLQLANWQQNFTTAPYAWQEADLQALILEQHTREDIHFYKGIFWVEPPLEIR